VGHDEGESGGEPALAVEGAGLSGLLADGAVEAFEDAGRAEAAWLPDVLAFASVSEGVEIGEGFREEAVKGGDGVGLAVAPGDAEGLPTALDLGPIGGRPDLAGILEYGRPAGTPGGAIHPRVSPDHVTDIAQDVEEAALAEQAGAEVDGVERGIEPAAAVMDQEGETRVGPTPRWCRRSSRPRQLGSSSAVARSQSSTQCSPLTGSTPYATSSTIFRRRFTARRRPRASVLTSPVGSSCVIQTPSSITTGGTRVTGARRSASARSATWCTQPFSVLRASVRPFSRATTSRMSASDRHSPLSSRAQAWISPQLRSYGAIVVNSTRTVLPQMQLTRGTRTRTAAELVSNVRS